MMEEKKDINSLIGFTLMGGVLLFYLWMQPPVEENIVSENENQTIETIDDKTLIRKDIVDNLEIGDDSFLINNDNLNFNENQVDDNKVITYENDLIFLEVNTKGGFISTLYLKNFTNHLEQPIYLVNNDNSEFNLNFNLSNNRNVNSKNLIFDSSKFEDDENMVIVMKHIVSDVQYLEYRYTIKPNDYMIDFSINSNGLSTIVNTQDNYELTWDYKSLRNSKSISYENRYSRLTYEYELDKIDKLGQ
jgi:YidC/Oxa1 family membrane protein insertase